MQPSRVLSIAARLCCLTAVAALGLAAPAAAGEIAGARSGSACQATGQEPKSLAFVVYHVDKRPGGEFIVTFENGDVWQQYQPDKKIELRRGDQVVIRRSSGGIFTLVSRDGQSTRVKKL